MTDTDMPRGYYMKTESTIKKIMGSAFVVLLVLTLLPNLAMGDRGFTIRVETDQTQYYPGEQVIVTIQLLKNGNGYPAGIRPEIWDPSENMIYGGTCYDSDSHGYYNITEFTLDLNASLGTYTISATAYADDWMGISNITFEVVSQATCGDANNDGKIDVGDIIYLINFLFKGPSYPAPVPQYCCGNANGDGLCTVGDVVYLINYLFKGGSAPGGCCERGI
jgi:hypothetical protein